MNWLTFEDTEHFPYKLKISQEENLIILPKSNAVAFEFELWLLGEKSVIVLTQTGVWELTDVLAKTY